MAKKLCTLEDCRELIPIEKQWAAKTRGVEPIYCSEKCYKIAKARRHNARVRLGITLEQQRKALEQ